METLCKKINQLLQTGFFHIFGSSVINKCLSFLSSVILVRVLSKIEYGRFTYAWNIYSMIILLNGFGADSAILQLCSERSNDKNFARKVVGYGTRYGIFSSIIIGIMLFFIALFIPLKIQNSNKLLILLFLLPVLQFTYSTISVILRSQKRNQEYAKLSMLNTTLHLLFSVVGAILFREDGLIVGYYFSYLLSCMFGISKMDVKMFNKDCKLERSEKKTILSISIVSACNDGLSQMMYLLDIFVLGVVAAQEAVLASYRVGMMIPSAMAFIPASLVIYIYPYFAEHRKDLSWCLQTYKKILLWFGSFNFAVSSLLIALAPFIINLLYGSLYLDAVSVFRILAANYFISATFRGIAGNLLVTQRKLKFNFFIVLISGIINIIFDFFFIRHWGSIGAAYATLFVTLIVGASCSSYLFIIFKRGKAE